MSTYLDLTATCEIDEHLSYVLRLLGIERDIASDEITRMIERTKVDDVDVQGH